jgi:hypothetical protein
MKIGIESGALPRIQQLGISFRMPRADALSCCPQRLNKYVFKCLSKYEEDV